MAGERIWEVSLPGEHDFDLYSRSLDGETLEQALTAVLELSEQHRIRDAILLVQYPSWEPLARRLADALGWRLVYDCMDEHTGFGTHGEQTAADEERLIRGADLVLATSRKLRGALEASPSRRPACSERRRRAPLRAPAVAGLEPAVHAGRGR